MASRITWLDKVLFKLSSLPAVQKFVFGDANEIKAVVNAHADDIEALQAAAPGTGDMKQTTYDPSGIQEQLVGLTATQSLTNKTVNGVVLDSAGLSTESLRADGTYVAASTGAASSVDITAKVNEAGGITAGMVVYISGATGGFATVGIASNDDYSKADVLAIATETKADNQNIIITTTGTVENIDTSAFTEGQQVYLGTNGALTNVHPGGILAVQRVGHIVKVNATTGSMIVEREPLTMIDDEDLTLRFNLVNQNTGTSASSSFTLINDAGHRSSLSLFGSNNTTFGPGLEESVTLYNQGYGPSLNFLDGNKSHVWMTDVTDAHAFAATVKMELTADGELITQQQDIIHTAIVSDDHALEIDCNVEGLGDVKAVDIVYDTGAIGVGCDEAIILINIDESAATDGHVTALEVLATEGNATLTGMLTGIGVNPIEQFSGVFADMDSALSNAVDVLTEFTTAGNDLQIFVNDNDTVTIGNAVKFEELEFLLAIVSSQTIQPVFEYSTGVGTWAAFSPIDGTNGMRNTGVIAWSDNDIPGWLVGTGSEFLIRITRTRNNVTTPPTESKVQISVVVEYSWDKDGNIIANTFNGKTLIYTVTDYTDAFTIPDGTDNATLTMTNAVDKNVTVKATSFSNVGDSCEVSTLLGVGFPLIIPFDANVVLIDPNTVASDSFNIKGLRRMNDIGGIVQIQLY